MAITYTKPQAPDFIPPIYIDRVILNSGPRDMVNVRLDLSTIDNLDDPNSSWLLRDDFLQFLKVRIFQTDSRKDTSKILQKDISQILEGMGEYKIWEFNLKDFVDPKKDKYLSETFFASGGDLIYKIPFIFNLDTVIGDHFSIFAHAFVDLEKLFESKGLTIPKNTFPKNTIGEISGENILNNGAVVTESSIFLTEKGELWTGQVAKSADNVFYAPGTQPREILKKITTPNYKIQDFRKIESLQVAPPVIKQSKEAFEKVQRRLLNNETLNFGVNTNNYFSTGLPSRGEDGKVSFIFDVDFQNLVTDKSVFGSLMETPAKEEILQNSRISEIKIFRRRVKRQTTSSKLGTTTEDISIFDRNEPWEMLVVGGEQQDERFLQTISYYGGVKRLNQSENNLIGRITEIRNTEKIRRFSSLDNSLLDKTFGLYQYGVELKIEDGTVIFLQRSLSEITEAIKIMENYYTTATSINYYDAFNRKFNKKLLKFYMSTNLGKGREPFPWKVGIKTYLKILTSLVSFNPSDITRIAKEMNAILNPRFGTPEGISAVIDLMKKLEDLIYSTLIGKVKISDQQVDGRPTRTFNNNSYEKFIISETHFFNSYVDSDVAIGDGIKILPTNSPILYLNDFEERASVEASKYFKETTPELISQAIGEVPGVNKENQGITNVEDSFYSFFSPEKIILQNQAIELQNRGNALWDNSQYERFTTFLMQSSDSPKPSMPVYSITETGNPKVASKDSEITPSISTLQLMENMLAKYSVTISTTLSENKDTKPTIPTAPPDCDVDFKSSGIRPDKKQYDMFLSKGVETVGGIFTSLGGLNGAGKLTNDRNNNSQPVKQPVIENFDLTSDKNYIDTSIRRSPIKEGQLEKMPNQITSLFISESPAVKNNWQTYKEDGIDFPTDEKTSLMFMYNYSTLFKIQYQSGYEKSKEGKEILSQPIWKTVDQAMLEMVREGKVFLCRSVKYENVDLGIVHSKLLDLPVIDEYFFMLKDEKTMEKVTKKPITTRKRNSQLDKVLKNSNEEINYEAAPFSRGLIRNK